MKAILVIDVPDTKNLVVSYRVFDRTNKNHEVMKGAKGLIPMPNKKPVSYHDDFFGEVEKNFNNIGWNACIDEILGETE